MITSVEPVELFGGGVCVCVCVARGGGGVTTKQIYMEEWNAVFVNCNPQAYLTTSLLPT